MRPPAATPDSGALCREGPGRRVLRRSRFQLSIVPTVPLGGAPCGPGSSIDCEGMQLSIVIPAHNEETTVAGVVAGHCEVARSLTTTFEIVVCDDGSTDGTWAALESHRSCPELRLIRNSARAGIPFTMKRLYADARGEWTYFAPADGQVPAAALARMWESREGAALVVGRRIPRRDPAGRVLIAQVYSAILGWIFRLPARDIDSVKLYRSEDLRAVPPRSQSNFFEAEILIALCSRGRTVREIDIPHRPRIAGQAKGVTAVDALRALRDVLAFTIGWWLRPAAALPARPAAPARQEPDQLPRP
jgi:glycosyltransferase involved in cell wall biosynthesis